MSTTDPRLSSIIAVIEHPATGAGERAAALAAYKRITGAAYTNGPRPKRHLILRLAAKGNAAERIAEATRLVHGMSA